MDLILRKALVELIQTTKFYGETMRPQWNDYRFKFVLMCVQADILSEIELKSVVRDRLLVWGRENYNWLFEGTTLPRWPEQSPCRSALAFAIREGELTSEEVDKIRFDYVETKESFLFNHNRDLVSVTIRQLCRLERPVIEVVPEPRYESYL